MAQADPGAKLAELKTWLVDAGPLVAYLDKRDPHHAEVFAVMDGFIGRMITTAAIITEAMHFASDTQRGPRSLADWISSSGTIVLDVCQPLDLLAAARLMERYRDTPMDFADATLVLAAEVVDVLDIFTLDRRGFSTFRTSDGRAFNLVLDAA